MRVLIPTTTTASKYLVGTFSYHFPNTFNITKSIRTPGSGYTNRSFYRNNYVDYPNPRAKVAPCTETATREGGTNSGKQLPNIHNPARSTKIAPRALHHRLVTSQGDKRKRVINSCSPKRDAFHVTKKRNYSYDTLRYRSTYEYSYVQNAHKTQEPCFSSK